MWKTKNVSHISTPPATTADKYQKRRYTNIPLGTKDRSGQSPAAHITPYEGIYPVVGGHYVEITGQQVSTRRYWKWCVAKTTYKTDAEYEEHFRFLLKQSIKRRMRCFGPILADLSGGIDSSSIVCVADLVQSENPSLPVPDTLSFYDEKEPLGDERHFVSVIENHRRKTGHHVDLGIYPESVSLPKGQFFAEPRFPVNETFVCDFQRMVTSHGYRVFLSGYAGDELLGGVPDPRYQLADLLLTSRLVTFLKQLWTWARIKKMPALKLCQQSIRALADSVINRKLHPPNPVLAGWVARSAAEHSPAIGDIQDDFRFAKPSQREYAMTISSILSAISHAPGQHLSCEDRRYPYLDRDLVQWLLSVPSTQLLRAGQRRSLMRRALSDIVPAEVLWRKTKGATGRRHLLALQNTMRMISGLMQNPVSGQMGFVDSVQFNEDLRKAAAGNSMKVVPMLKEISLEVWLRHLIRRGIILSPAALLDDHADLTLSFHSSAAS